LNGGREAVIMDTVEKIRDLLGGWDRFPSLSQALVGLSVGMDVLLEGKLPPSGEPRIPKFLIGLCPLGHGRAVA
jgi:hypothetical protein